MKKDAGRKETDKVLSEMEKRIAEEYRIASQEAALKLDNFLQRSYARDEEKRTQLENGEISRKEYEQWREGQIMTGQRWKAMTENLAEDYHNANNIAKSIVNGYMPEVYAINHNYGTYEVEHGLKVDTNYALYDRNTVEWIIKNEKELIPPVGKKVSEAIAAGKDIKWNERQVNSAMLQSILQGESIPKMAERVAEAVGEKNYKSAVRNARTMTTRAENYGRLDSYKRATDMGIKMKKQWIATLDQVTRDSHVDLDGETVPVDSVFSNGMECPGGMGPPEEVYNCFVGDVKAATDSNIVRSYKHEYDGELYSVKTARGVEFTCTPNHPILTPRGWVAASLLNEGDDLLVTFLGKERFSGSNPDINHAFARFDTIHQLADELGGKRTRTLSVAFHGDIPTSEVEVITLERLLGNNWNAVQAEKQRKRVFKLTDTPLVCKSAFVKHLGAVCSSAFGFIRGLCQSLPFFGRRVGHSREHGFGAVADMNPVLPKYAINNLPTETMIRGNLLRGLSADVFVDKVVSVNVIMSNCHVYNLQTENGYYFVNSSISKSNEINNGIVAIAKNCRCTMIAQLEGFEDDASDLSLRNTDKFGDMDYDEWKEEHRSRIDEAELAARNDRRSGDTAEARYRRAVEDFKNIKNPTEDDIKKVGAALRERMEEIYEGHDQIEDLKEAYSDACKGHTEAWVVQNDIDSVWNMFNEDLQRTGYQFTKDDSTDRMLWRTFFDKEKDNYIQARIRGIEAKLEEFGVKVSDTDTVFDVMKKMETVVNSRVDKYNSTYDAYTKVLNNLRGRTAADALKGELSKVRDMGTPEGINLKEHLNNSRSPKRKSVEEAYSYYPTAWVQNSVDYGNMNVKTNERGFYRHSETSDANIAISGRTEEASLKTSIHELGHRFERTQNLLADEKTFYDRRTASEDAEWLGQAYRKEERTRKDDFYDSYVGKDYGGRAYEVVSMGFESAYMNPTELFKDPDMTDLIYGILSVR